MSKSVWRHAAVEIPTIHPLRVSRRRDANKRFQPHVSLVSISPPSSCGRSRVGRLRSWGLCRWCRWRRRCRPRWGTPLARPPEFAVERSAEVREGGGGLDYAWVGSWIGEWESEQWWLYHFFKWFFHKKKILLLNHTQQGFFLTLNIAHLVHMNVIYNIPGWAPRASMALHYYMWWLPWALEQPRPLRNRRCLWNP